MLSFDADKGRRKMLLVSVLNDSDTWHNNLEVDFTIRPAVARKYSACVAVAMATGTPSGRGREAVGESEITRHPSCRRVSVCAGVETSPPSARGLGRSGLCTCNRFTCSKVNWDRLTFCYARILITGDITWRSLAKMSEIEKTNIRSLSPAGLVEVVPCVCGSDGPVRALFG